MTEDKRQHDADRGLPLAGFNGHNIIRPFRGAGSIERNAQTEPPRKQVEIKSFRKKRDRKSDRSMLAESAQSAARASQLGIGRGRSICDMDEIIDKPPPVRATGAAL
jgi:hypothetical protein